MLITPFGLRGGGGLGCTVGCWNGSRIFPHGGLKNGGAGGGPNGGHGGWGPNDEGRGGDGGGNKLKLSSSSFGPSLFFNFSNLFLTANSTPGCLGAFFISSLAMSIFPTSSSFRSDTTIGFSASNVEISLRTSSSRFYLLKIFLLIGSNFCLKLALLILSFVT